MMMDEYNSLSQKLAKYSSKAFLQASMGTSDGWHACYVSDVRTRAISSILVRSRSRTPQTRTHAHTQRTMAVAVRR